MTSRGFTLVGILLVIAINAIVAAVLIPLLSAPRELAFDTATQTCLKEPGTLQEAAAVDSPFTYDTALDPTAINACQNVTVVQDFVTDNDYRYTGLHDQGEFTYQVTPGTPVTEAP